MNEADIADQLIEEHFEKSWAAHERRKARAALDRPIIIDGAVCCRDCESEIPSDRLEKQPGAARCVRCQERHETRKGR